MNYFFCCDIYVFKLKNRTFITTRTAKFLNYFIFAVQCFFFAICKSTKLLNFTKLKIS